MKTLIAFTGAAGAGKTTAANIVCWNYHGLRHSFAEPLRQMLYPLGLGPDAFSQERKNKPHPHLGGKTPREALQLIGTDCCRKMIYENIWLDAMRRQYEAHREKLGGMLFVIDDCRFDNEAQLVRDLGGIIIKLEGPGLQKMAHESERGVSAHLVDHVIQNPRQDLNDLQLRIEQVLTS